MAKMQMPFPRLAQVGFPARTCPVEQTAEHYRAEELDLIVQRLMPRPAFYLTAGREHITAGIQY